MLQPPSSRAVPPHLADEAAGHDEDLPLVALVLLLAVELQPGAPQHGMPRAPHVHAGTCESDSTVMTLPPPPVRQEQHGIARGTSGVGAGLSPHSPFFLSGPSIRIGSGGSFSADLDLDTAMFDPLIGIDQVGMASSLLEHVSVLRIGLTEDAGVNQGCMQPSC